MATLVSYDLNGKKLSFANWISNLSPQETPFVSMTGKESINQTLFQWQTDSLNAASGANRQIEGSTATEGALNKTSVLNNVTQILRKVVKVSDTANALANYGRGRELQYQMEKAGKEIKRDLEMSLLSANEKKVGNGSTVARLTAGFKALVAAVDEEDDDTGAKVHFGIAGSDLAESDIWEMTYNLYLSGACADTIMFHPSHAAFFSSLMEVGTGSRKRMFDGSKDTKINTYVTEVVDPLGCAYKLIPNRWMPVDAIYFFCPKDWTQMVLRAPERIKLAKDGSYEKWMIELEVGLRHRNPFASGVLELTPPAPVPTITTKGPITGKVGDSTTTFNAMFDATNSAAADYDFVVAPTAAGTVSAAGVLTLSNTASGTVTVKATHKVTGTVTATTSFTGVTPKLTSMTATAGTGGTLASGTLTIANYATPAAGVELTIAGVPAGAVLGALTTAKAGTDAAKVTATVSGNKVTIKASGVIASTDTKVTITAAGGGTALVITVKATA